MAEKQIGIRADEAITTKFKEVAEGFDSNGTCLEALLNAYALTQAEKELPGQETSIADFRALADSIVKAYISALELSANAETRIRQEFQQKLDSKDSMIISLQESIEALEARVQAADERAVNAETDAKAQIANAEKTSQDLQNELDRIAQKTAEQEESIRTKESMITDKERIIISLQAELDKAKKDAESVPELEARAATAEKSLVEAQESIKTLTQKLAATEKAAEQAAEIALERSDLAVQKAIADERCKAAQQAKEYTEEIKSLYAQNSELKDQIQKLKLEAIQSSQTHADTE